MARTRKKAAEVTTEDTAVTGTEETIIEPTTDTSFNPAEFDPSLKQKADEVVQAVADATRMDTPTEQPANGFAAQHAPTASGHAAAVGRKQYTQAPDPFSVEGISGDGNRVRLLKSTADQAWVIRFDKNPNEMTDDEGVKYSKERPHPVLKMLKDEGYRWGFADADGKGGWGKLMQEGHYTYAEHMDARKVLAKASEMIGARVEQGAGIPD